jgi:hypothetical protein
MDSSPGLPGMHRRHFLLTSLVGAVAVPLGAGAQPSKVWRIGQLVTSGSALDLDTFRQRLGERGYFEGQNLLIEYRNGTRATSATRSISISFCIFLPPVVGINVRSVF